MKDFIESSRRVRISRILVSKGRGAIHFRNAATNADDKRTAGNLMQFPHFVESEGGLRIDTCSAK